jgi:hypothetical protein
MSLTYHSSVAVIINPDSGIYTFQLKDSNYPVEVFQGTISLFGGNWIDPTDESPVCTMKRELTEELPEISGMDLENGLISFDEYLIRTPEGLTGREYSFVMSVFGLVCEKILTRCDEGFLYNSGYYPFEKFSWGHERVVEDYVRAMGFRPNLRGFPEVSVKRLGSDPSVPYLERDLGQYKWNPLLLGNVDDIAVFGD